MSALRPRPQPFEKLRICKAEYRRLRRTKIPATDFRSWHFSDMPTWPLDVCSRRNIGLKIPWRDVSIQVASRHGGTTCDPKERFGNSLALSWIACSENLEGHSL
jgi:hypothetical protein